MTTTQTTLAKRLFDFIRNGKKALGELMPENTFSNSPGFDEREALKSLIWQMQGFERQYRGAQKWLAGIDAPEGFASDATRSALNLVQKLLTCQAQLTGPFWFEMLSIPGMHQGEFTTVARTRIKHLLEAAMRAFVGVKAEFRDDQVLSITLTTESATRTIEKPFPAPNVEGLSLEQQIVALNRYWTEIKQAAREIAKDPAHWPSKGESKDIEQARVEELVEGFLRGLSFKDTELLRKHREQVKRIINTSL